MDEYKEITREKELFNKLSYEQKVDFLAEKIELDYYATQKIINLLFNLLAEINTMIVEEDKKSFDKDYYNENAILNTIYCNLSENIGNNIYEAYATSIAINEEEENKINNLMEEIGDERFLEYIRERFFL